MLEASIGLRYQKIVFQSNIDDSLMASNITLLETKNDQKFENVAHDLRNCIKNIHRHTLPSRVTANDITEGECEISEILINFMRDLIQGSSISDEDDYLAVKISSICSDIIYGVTRGRCKPAKSLTFGLEMKSLTNSQPVITMINRYGHTIGYNLAEELETEMTYTSVQAYNAMPNGIIPSNGHSTHVAFDNFR